MSFAAEDRTQEADTQDDWQRPAEFYDYYEPDDGCYYGVIMDKYNASTEYVECELWFVVDLTEAR